MQRVVVHAVVEPSAGIRVQRRATRNDDQTPPRSNRKLCNDEHLQAY